ncbi:MAG TPA: Lrp/AsnC family transcriptional regulator [Candidatus Limousia pullorum]|uniref:Lrp/AsnC family transcriptional regulator n=1 Tax=Candidatus Limousia pullorum TaxID=2840860 RepID=A0A9D1S8T4_9FIRM|nr:Lrp/AsnC family transcriptional regulator [Anaeromassilibacillus sp. An172]MCI6495937.1 Lrp/AsnC family transcriptional regulator [Anaeromassilibacillus sp.]MDY3778889.1 Lrp/AsnC family transcriptional regulator [Candidatus Limousia pullorum]MEE0762443.1 Lrp/AsnC family transcriptional regulator [Acutalibacteraceae bacterium]OUP79361.1 AsnC family transcriptional regulator [Anaeromassilibacillus sp. An172]HIU50663.1 Lrp/AsnC family transcriptional regulator [Candidatus Limousia pullorum]
MNRLLALLSESTNFSTAQLAMMLNEPEDYIKAQIREYEKSGIIVGYKALVNWEKVQDAGVTALIELKVTPKMETGFDEIAQRITEFEQVESVYLMAGAYDLAVYVRGETIQDVATFVSRKLSAMEGIISTATHFLLKRYKEGGILLDSNIEKQEEREGI